MNMDVEFLILPNGRCPVEEFFDDLDNKTLAKISKLVDALKEYNVLGFPHARKMIGYNKLWELRISSDKKAVRVFYVYVEKNKIIFVSAFSKKTQKTPQKEIDRAIGYLKQSGIKL